MVESVESVNSRTPFSHEITVAQRMMAASSGSLLTGLVVTPFDVVRVRMQQQSAWQPHRGIVPKPFPVENVPKQLGVTSCCREIFWMPNSITYCVADSSFEDCAREEAQKRKFTGTWDGIKKIVKFEGVSTLWRGLSLTLLSAIPSNVVYFTAYEYMRDNSPINSSPLNPLICGALARSVSATVISPLELAKTRMQGAVGDSSQGNCKTVFKGVQAMVRNEGVFSLWRGLVLTLWRDVPFSAIYWGCVEYIRDELSKLPYFQRSNDSTFTKAFIAGSIGGAIAAVATTPFDVGKTRRQIDPNAVSSNSRMIPYMFHIIRNEGFPALFVGCVPRVLKVAPACAIMISSYEKGKKLFGEKNREALLLSSTTTME